MICTFTSSGEVPGLKSPSLKILTWSLEEAEYMFLSTIMVVLWKSSKETDLWQMTIPGWVIGPKNHEKKHNTSVTCTVSAEENKSTAFKHLCSPDSFTFVLFSATFFLSLHSQHHQCPPTVDDVISMCMSFFHWNRNVSPTVLKCIFTCLVTPCRCNWL